jgi:hypothetical protein
VIRHIGTLSVGLLCPALVAAQAAYASLRLQALARLNAQLAAQLKLKAVLTLQVPGAEIAAKIDAAARVAASIAANVQAPGAQLQLAAVGSAIDSIEAQIAALAELTLPDGPGVDVFAYAGPASAFGGELGGVLAGGLPSGGGPTASTNALVLATTIPATWAAMQAVLRMA